MFSLPPSLPLFFPSIPPLFTFTSVFFLSSFSSLSFFLSFFPSPSLHLLALFLSLHPFSSTSHSSLYSFLSSFHFLPRPALLVCVGLHPLFLPPSLIPSVFIRSSLPYLLLHSSALSFFFPFAHSFLHPGSSFISLHFSSFHPFSPSLSQSAPSLSPPFSSLFLLQQNQSGRETHSDMMAAAVFLHNQLQRQKRRGGLGWGWG